jgi:Protein of unknown function (DUF3102)
VTYNFKGNLYMTQPNYVPADEEQVVPRIDLAPAPVTDPVSDWAGRIAAAWQENVAAIFKVGELLSEAKTALPHGGFQSMVRSDLAFTPRTAQMLMKIASDARLRRRSIVSLLPRHWATLHEITRLSDVALDAKVKDGTIRPTMRRKELVVPKPDPKPDKIGGRGAGESSECEPVEVIAQKASFAEPEVPHLELLADDVVTWGECSPVVRAIAALAKAIEAGPEDLAIKLSRRSTQADPNVRSAIECDIGVCARFFAAPRNAHADADEGVHAFRHDATQTSGTMSPSIQ